MARNEWLWQKPTEPTLAPPNFDPSPFMRGFCPPSTESAPADRMLVQSRRATSALSLPEHGFQFHGPGGSVFDLVGVRVGVEFLARFGQFEINRSEERRVGKECRS